MFTRCRSEGGFPIWLLARWTPLLKSQVPKDTGGSSAFGCCHAKFAREREQVQNEALILLHSPAPLGTWLIPAIVGESAKVLVTDFAAIEFTLKCSLPFRGGGSSVQQTGIGKKGRAE